jgi:ElaB/YqjD/DUF883 family membrane-anchored ribosome-binding protein
MANEDLQAEIELLRQQLNALQSDRESASASTEPEKDEQDKEQKEPATALDEILSEVDMDKLDLAAQFRELLDSLDKDIKDTKPSTLLIVFALGVLIGHLR